ncbi:MAG: PEP-CTERM sorting domain-containing protein [Bryobacteraceae bacterium]
MLQRICAVFLLSTSLATAAPTLSNAVFANYRETVTPAVFNNVFCNTMGTGAALQCSDTVALSDTGGLSLTYSAYSESAFGTLKTRAEATLSGTGSTPASRLSVVRGGATFTDDFLFTGLPTGTAGVAHWLFQLTGSTAGYGNGNLANATISAFSGPTIFSSVTLQNPTNVLLTTPIVFGQSMTLSFNLVALININNFISGLSLSTLWDNTAVLSGLSVTDAQGNLQEFDVTGASAAGYLADLPEAIPEPSTMILAACGLAALALRRN